MMKFDWIVNKLKERIYPYTHADAVIMDENNKKLTVTINEINERIDNIEEISSSHDFALNDDLINHIENASMHIPTGGEVGQVLTKTAEGNNWASITSGGTGSISIEGETTAIAFTSLYGAQSNFVVNFGKSNTLFVAKETPNEPPPYIFDGGENGSYLVYLLRKPTVIMYSADNSWPWTVEYNGKQYYLAEYRVYNTHPSSNITVDITKIKSSKIIS